MVRVANIARGCLTLWLSALLACGSTWHHHVHHAHDHGHCGAQVHVSGHDHSHSHDCSHASSDHADHSHADHSHADHLVAVDSRAGLTDDAIGLLPRGAESSADDCAICRALAQSSAPALTVVALVVEAGCEPSVVTSFEVESSRDQLPPPARGPPRVG